MKGELIGTAIVLTFLISALLLTGGSAQAQVRDCSNCHDDGRTLSAEMCSRCHGDMHAEWEESAHADSLKAAGGMVATDPQCQTCHVEGAIKENWGRTDIETAKEEKEPITCEICHAPPKGGYFEHFSAGPHGTQRPEVTLSAELCGNCHKGAHHPTINEWNEYEAEDFNPEEEASHSEPTEGYAKRDACVACKSAAGGIKNLEKPGIYDLNEEELPSADTVEEWRVTCVACHDPHEAELRMDNTTRLCANCHNSEMEEIEPDGETTEVHHPQWGMYRGSTWATGESHPQLGCTNCHMATRHVDEEAGIPASTGHTFDVNEELLGSKHLTEEVKCANCHAALGATIEETRAIIEERISNVEALKEEATSVLKEENNEDLISTYNNGAFYLSFVEHDASLGIHNFAKASSSLSESYSLLSQAKAGAEKLALQSEVSKKEEEVSSLEGELSDLREKLKGKYGLPYVIIAVVIGLIIGGLAVYALKR